MKSLVTDPTQIQPKINPKQTQNKSKIKSIGHCSHPYNNQIAKQTQPKPNLNPTLPKPKANPTLTNEIIGHCSHPFLGHDNPYYNQISKSGGDGHRNKKNCPDTFSAPWQNIVGFFN